MPQSEAPQSYSFAALRELAMTEADRIAVTQDALVHAGYRAEHYAPELARRHMFLAVARLLDRMRDPAIKTRLRELAAEEKAAAV